MLHWRNFPPNPVGDAMIAFLIATVIRYRDPLPPGRSTSKRQLK
jgi:hypothetical protein